MLKLLCFNVHHIIIYVQGGVKIMLINLRASTVAAGILSTLIIIKESCFATRMKWGMFGFCNHTYCIMITFPTLHVYVQSRAIMKVVMVGETWKSTAELF